MAGQNIPYDGYPAPAGRTVKIDWSGDHWGPGNTQGNYNTGGYNLNATALGMVRFESVGVSSQSQSGNYFAKVFYPAVSGNNELRAPTYGYVTVKWYYAANNNEVAANTNLNGEVVQLTAIGI